MTDPIKLAAEIEGCSDPIPFSDAETRLIAAALRLAEACQVIVDDEGVSWPHFDSELFAAYRKAREGA